MHGHPRSPSLRVSDGETGVRSISGVNEATNANEADQRRAARKRFRAQYRALYDELVEILFQLDPIGVHFDKAEKFVPEATTIMARWHDCARPDWQTTSNTLSNKNSGDGTGVDASPTRIPNDWPTQPSPSAVPGITFSK
jgi:hypothetical protein